MDNIIKFEKSNIDVEIDEVGEKAWLVMSNYIDRDFSSAGVASYADQFKVEFKPVFESLFVYPIALPLIQEDDLDPLHQEWREGLLETHARLKEFTQRLVHSTYDREVYRFCLEYIN